MSETQKLADVEALARMAARVPVTFRRIRESIRDLRVSPDAGEALRP
jgi:hypothetical protein